MTDDMTKAELRKIIKAEKHRLGEDVLLQMSDRVVSLLEHHPVFIHASTVLLYYSLPDEVATHDLLMKYADQKTILLPVVVDDNLQLRVYRPERMRTGAFGIMEPEGEAFTRYADIDLAVIPGMGFDDEGHRLGRGRGFYDRLLPFIPCEKIGLCFPFQYMESIPSEPHDIRVDEVIHG